MNKIIDLADYTCQIDYWREAAKRHWFSVIVKSNTSLLTPHIPGYFIDRISFREFMRNCGMNVPNDSFEVGASWQDIDWITAVSNKMVGVSRLGHSPLDIHSRIGCSDWLVSKLDDWANHLKSHGLDVPENHFVKFLGQTWISFFSSSVTAPFFLPAIPGPTFAERISEKQLKLLIQKYDESIVWEFYKLLIISHDGTHALQTGDPLFSEFVLAHLWCDFLDKFELWAFQTNRKTGEIFNTEYEYLVNMCGHSRLISDILSDTSKLSNYSDNLDFYGNICLLGFQFDMKKYRYAIYLSKLRAILLANLEPKYRPMQ